VTNFHLKQTAQAIKELNIIPSDQVELIKKFANVTQIKFFLPRQTIFRQNSLADGFFYIISGIV
jgi:CRP-like cAMP-binding protein